MKLRNKQTGEIKPAEAREDGIYLYDETTEQWYKYELDLLAKWWEYYEEPKEQFNITPPLLEDDNTVLIDFLTHKEAEKAAEKLKAWQRLKDKGFKFTGWATNAGIRGVDFEVPDSFFSEHNHSCISDETRNDLDLLFSQEAK